MKKLIMTFFILMSFSYAEVLSTDSAPVAPDYDQMFPTEDEQNAVDGESMVGDDSLDQQNIGGTIGYQSGLGLSNLTKSVGDDGKNRYFLDGVEVTNFKENSSSNEYKDSLRSFNLDIPATEEEKDARNEAINAARELRKDQNIENGMTPKRMEDAFLGGVNATAVGSSFVNSKILSSGTLEYDEGADETEFYRNNFGSSTELNKAANTNGAGKLKDAYEFVDNFKAIMNAKYTSKSISCFVSRELIPKYYCPMVGRTETKFGGDNNISEASAKAECGTNCQKEISCLPYKVVDSLNFVVKEGTVPLYPNWNSATTFFTSNEISNKMQVKEMTYTVKVRPSASWTGTTEEFEKYLDANPIKFKYSVVKREDSIGNPPLLLIDRQTVKLTSTITSITIPVITTTETFYISFYKPYFTENAAVADYLDDVKWANIGAVEVSELKGEYSDHSLYFCPYSQLVDFDYECDGQGGEGVITVSNGSQILNICTDSDHKIGPDRRLGGFYSQETCNQNCIESEDCLPTYSHYTSYDSDAVYKVEVSCVDDPDNTSCTVEKCKALITEEETNGTVPLNEWVVYNDDDIKQTIANTVLQPNVVRPKFNLDSELNITTSYDIMFQSQMKDAAFQNMLDDGSYNRIEYRLGEESPRKMSYSTQYISGVQNMMLNLKPQSKIIDNNKEYNLYVVMEIDQLYSPIAGLFIIDGQSVQADRNGTSGLQFRDKTYAIRQGDSATLPWKVFKKAEKTNYKKTYDVKRCEDGVAVEGPLHSFDNVVIPEGCVVEKQVMWPATPYMTVERNAFYDSTTDSFLTYSSSEVAEVYQKQKFSSDNFINSYQISSFLFRDIEDVPGGLIRDQESYNHDLSFKKIYNTEYGDTTSRGYVYDYTLYAFYSETALTYNQVIERITEENAFYSKTNPGKYRRSIPHDGELNSNIEPFILGDINTTTVNMEITPFLEEEGQKVFKFLFLHDDKEGDNFSN